MFSKGRERMKIAVLASGRGSNFQSIIDSVQKGYIKADIDVLVTDRGDAFAIERARTHHIDAVYLDPKDFDSKDHYFRHIADLLAEREIGLIALAGFMRIVRKPLVAAFPNKILNIHPALLPSFPGLHGQKQALEYGVKISGCTVHFVDEGMDTGPIIVQAAVPVYSDDSEESLSQRILACEHRIYPFAIRVFIENRLEIRGRKVYIKGEKEHQSFLIHPFDE
jgi:phosphoribosylglycinamide formyltransferase-1